MKLKWKVDPLPTGKFRSFQTRGWPSAVHAGTEHMAARIDCDDAYKPAKVKTGEHRPLRVRITEWFDPAERGTRAAFEWRTLAGEFATLKEAKAAAQQALNERPEYWPKGTK